MEETEINIPTQSPVEPKPGEMLRRNLITSVIKEDQKGNVFTAVHFQYVIHRIPVIIKEGKSTMPADHFGRTMRDRLKWQMHVHRKLSGKVNVPAIKDFFDHKGNSYLVMEFIEGKTLRKYVADIFQKRIWHYLDEPERLDILRVIFQLTEQIERMHEQGFVHRDLSPDNILVTPSGKVYLVDLELSYSIKDDYPSPPLALGTAGYMSPEQRLRLRPEVTEDIYALGCVLLTAVTNFPPLKFNLQKANQLSEPLRLLGIQWKLGNVISACIWSDKSERCGIVDVRVGLDRVMSEPYDSEKDLHLWENPKRPDYWHLGTTITSYFRLLIDKDFNEHNNLNPENINSGLTVDTQGIFYVMGVHGRENMLGTVVNFFKKALKGDYSPYYLACSTNLPGLLCGEAGNALAYNGAYKMGIMGRGGSNGRSYHCLRDTATTIDLANGVAGQALTALMMIQEPENEHFEKRLNELIQILLDAQAADGSWPLKELRLADGISGILLTLIKFYQWRPNDDLGKLIKKGLDDLVIRLISARQHPLLAGAAEVKNISLIGGSSGIALVLCYAYEQFNNPQYLQLAEDILNEQHDHGCSYDFSLESGLAGIGIVYIEAARITGNERWEKRAAWISQLFEKMAIPDERYNLYWNCRGLDYHDASFLSGNAGILYFLMRMQHYVDPEKGAAKKIPLF